MAKNRYFKCNVLGGFRLSDLNKNVKQGEYFFVDGHVAETSRAVIAATRERWMIEVSEKEASKHVKVPREVSKGGVQPAQIRKKGAVNQSSNVAIPDVSEVNKNLESRQAANNKLDQVATPNIEEVSKRVEEKIKEQKSNKVITPSGIEKAATAKQSEEDKASLPDFKKVEEKQKAERNATTATSDEDIAKQADMEVIPSPAVKKAEEKEAKKEEVKEEKKETVEVKKDEVVSSLSNDDVFDNTQLATPNFDEKKETTEVKKDLDKKIQRKKKKRKYTRRKKETESAKE